jgi:hypothetical protein
LRTPLLAQIRELSQKGDQLAAEPESQDPVALAQQRKEIETLTLAGGISSCCCGASCCG